MDELDDALDRLREVAPRLAAANADRDLVQHERDAALWAARDAGASWDALEEAAGGISRATVSKILRRR